MAVWHRMHYHMNQNQPNYKCCYFLHKPRYSYLSDLVQSNLNPWSNDCLREPINGLTHQRLSTFTDGQMGWPLSRSKASAVNSGMCSMSDVSTSNWSLASWRSWVLKPLYTSSCSPGPYNSASFIVSLLSAWKQIIKFQVGRSVHHHTIQIN